MKSIKVMSLALLGFLTLSAYGAKAEILEDYLKVSVSLTVVQQALYDTNKSGDGITYVSTVQKQKVGNKVLLKLLAEMFDTTWPAGAQLEYDMAADQLIVADKTGTNVLFYCGDGVSDESREAFVTLDFFYRGGPYSGTGIDATPGSGKYTGYWQGTIAIHYDNFSDESVYTDFQGNGLNIEKYSEKYTSTSRSLSRGETFTPFTIGFAANVDAIVTGKITAKGKTTASAPR